MSALNPIPQSSYPTHQILTRTNTVILQPLVTASSAYTANNCVGGRLIFPNIFGAQQSGIVQNITVTCRTTQSTGYKLYIFSDNPSNTTITDKATPTLNALDVPKLVDVITLGTADSTLTPTINVTDNIGRAIVSPTPNLYAILLTTATPTYTAITDLFVSITVLQD